MKNITPAILVDLGICPTCYDLAHDRCLYGDPTERILYDNDRFSCLLITNPRAPGHTIISTKYHYKDMMELPEELCKEIFDFSRKVMIAVYMEILQNAFSMIMIVLNESFPCSNDPQVRQRASRLKELCEGTP